MSTLASSRKFATYRSQTPANHEFNIETQQQYLRYDTRCYFNVRSKADISQLNLPHGAVMIPKMWILNPVIQSSHLNEKCYVATKYTVVQKFEWQHTANESLISCRSNSSQLVGILNRQSRAERQNTFDWLHILPVRVTTSQYKSYSVNISHILPARVTISQIKSCSANGSDILPVEVIFCQQKLNSASINHVLPI